MRTNACLALLLLAVAPVAFANVQDTCAGGSEVLAGFTVPPTFSQSLAENDTADFSISGASCSADDIAAASDVVACFTPANSCNVTITCATAAGDNAADLVEGTCSTTVSTCAASDSTTGGDAVIVNQSLTAGQDYCVVCTSSGLLATITLEIAAQGGSDCGTMPVEIRSFDVE